jgi:hypothetical protein
MNCSNLLRRRWPVFGLSVVVLLAGCGREEVKTYRVAKEAPPASPSPAMPHGHPDMQTGRPQLAWTLPAGWRELGPGQMSLATFAIAGSNGQEAQVSVTPLRGLAGKEVPIVNMWREQVGLPELSEDEAQQQLLPVEIAGEAGKMFEIQGRPAGTNPAVRIVTAMVHRPDASWFYKLAGDAELVEAQKTAFVTFLKSIKITESPATEAVAAVAASAPAAPTKWKTPADWKSVPPGPMQSVKFAVPDQGTAKADVTISVFPNSTGGVLANVNRWRNQIGLPPVGEADLTKIVSPLDDKIPDSFLVDMTNGSRQLIGAIVPRDGQWYFFKLLGDAGAVAPQKEAFVTFAQAQP